MNPSFVRHLAEESDKRICEIITEYLIEALIENDGATPCASRANRAERRRNTRVAILRAIEMLNGVRSNLDDIRNQVDATEAK